MWKSLYFTFLFETDFYGYRILDWKFLSFIIFHIWKMFLLFLICIVSRLKFSTFLIFEVPCLFSLVSFVLSNLMTLWFKSSFLRISLLSFLCVWIYSFHQVRSLSANNFFSVLPLQLHMYWTTWNCFTSHWWSIHFFFSPFFSLDNFFCHVFMFVLFFSGYLVCCDSHTMFFVCFISNIVIFISRGYFGSLLYFPACPLKLLK